MALEIKTNPEVLEHDLNQYFPELLKFESIEETQESGVYLEIQDKVEEILNAVVQERYAPTFGSRAVALDASGGPSGVRTLFPNLQLRDFRRFLQMNTDKANCV